jgi:DNA-binding MarR family transcriptional regulator
LRSQLSTENFDNVLVMAPTTGPRSGHAEPRWLDDVEMAAWRGYVDTIDALDAVLELDLVEHGLTMGDYEVLVRLSEAPDHALRMCDLAGQLRLSPSGLTRRLDGLVRNGVVARVPSDHDRRVMLAVLTPAGRELLAAAAPDHLVGVRRHFVDLLTRDELRTLGTVFAKVRAGLEAEQNAEPWH